MTGVIGDSEDRYYGYNGFSRMNLAVVGDTIVNYEYDHTGIRTAKLVDGIRTDLINDGDSVVAELRQGEVNNYYSTIFNRSN